MCQVLSLIYIYIYGAIYV